MRHVVHEVPGAFHISEKSNWRLKFVSVRQNTIQRLHVIVVIDI